MTQDLRFWKCPDCHGTGKVIVGHDRIEQCCKCDGTGNAFVDGVAAAHRRALDRIKKQKGMP